MMTLTVEKALEILEQFRELAAKCCTAEVTEVFDMAIVTLKRSSVSVMLDEADRRYAARVEGK